MLSTSAPEGRPGATVAAVLRVAVVGAGRWGTNVIRAFQATPSAALSIVCDRSPERLHAVDGQFDRLTDFQEVLDSPTVEAIAIATPPSSHSALAVAALDAGKHVFVEKPMAVSLEGALAVRAAAARNRRRVMVGYVLQHHPAVSALVSTIGTAALGAPLAVLSHRGGGRQPGAAHPAWWSLAPHDVSLAESLFGRAAQSISAVEDPATGEQHATLAYASGQHTRLCIEPHARRRHRRFILLGTRGAAVFDDLEPLNKLKLYSLRLDPAIPLEEVAHALKARRFVAPKLATDEPLKLEIAHFVQSVRAQAPFRTDVDHAVDVVNALAAGEWSQHRNGLPVPIADWHRPYDQRRQALGGASASSS